MEEVPDFGAVFTFGKSRFGDDNANKFWVKNDPVVAVACGDEHTAVITASGRPYTFGSNQWGQLALGHTRQTNKPSFVKSLKGSCVTHVACGRNHTLFGLKDEVYGCGGNGEHQIDGSTEDEITSPTPLPSLSGVRVARLSCGVEHSLVLGECGEVYLWGSGGEGQLGMGLNVTELRKPTILQFSKEKIRDAACGYYHTGLVTQSGKVFTFGENDNGKLGLGEDSDDSYHVPQPVFLVDSANRICCGNTCTAVMTSSGSLYMCGDGQRGQLGFSPDSLTRCVYTLTKVPCPPIRDMSVGEGHTAVVSKSGHLYTFGDGRHGKLCHGDDNFATLHSPYLVESFSTIATVGAVSCGGCHTMVIARPGRPYQDTARSKRHNSNKQTGNRLSINDNIKEASPEIRNLRDLDNNHPSNHPNNHPSNHPSNHPNNYPSNQIGAPQIVEEKVKTLESALCEDPDKRKTVNIHHHKKQDRKYEWKKEEEGRKKEEEGRRKEKEGRRKEEEWRRKEEESGSETDEPGATSDVTDSEEDGGLMENVMGIEDLQEAEPDRGVIQVTSSTVPESKSEPPRVSTNKKEPPRVSPNKTESPRVAPKKKESPRVSPAKKPSVVPEEETETDDEGESEYESEDEEEDEEEEKKEEPVKTLVSEHPAQETKKEASTNNQNLANKTDKQTEKQGSKFKFWKRKKKELQPPTQPRTQTNSAACVVL